MYIVGKTGQGGESEKGRKWEREGRRRESGRMTERHKFRAGVESEKGTQGVGEVREGEIDIERGGEMRDTNVKKLSKKRNLKLSHLSCSFAALLSTNLLRSCRMKAAAAAAAHFKRTDGSFSFLSHFLNQNFFQKKCRKEEKIIKSSKDLLFQGDISDASVTWHIASMLM